ncbi:hypothetical protein GCM10023206_03800 [Acinetobacter puyangensis]|uniref:Uncharacterized protein n=1 Tax=Acinetobacter puyangensis TaxID=1096779 RepID=A0A240EEL9_9GAMM|nr:hypothetical protein [Acinetobacter puyangensis]SNX46996.1 hypothetical protein SAMN05421731_1311 [Acinetobacter puyangensis]
MNINCPYCYSEHVSRVMPQPSSANSNLSSMTCAGIGATLSKSLPLPKVISPLLGGLAGAVVGGLIDSLIQPSKAPQQPVPYFHCHNCQCDFQ